MPDTTVKYYKATRPATDGTPRDPNMQTPHDIERSRTQFVRCDCRGCTTTPNPYIQTAADRTHQ